MENLPTDPFMLLSYINMKLRDEFDSFEELCEALDVDRVDLEHRLNSAGYEYMPEINQFR